MHGKHLHAQPMPRVGEESLRWPQPELEHAVYVCGERGGGLLPCILIKLVKSFEG